MTLTNGYRYKVPGQTRNAYSLNRLEQINVVKDPVPLTGWVQGKRASNLEERFARALNKAGLIFNFQEKVAAAGGIPGQEKVIDFMVEDGVRYPIEIDGVIAHLTAGQKGQDLVREIVLNHTFIRRGILPIQRVKWWQLETQEMANRLVRELFGGGR